MAGFCEYGDEISGSGATEVVSYNSYQAPSRPLPIVAY
jgi:hypothetical protein